MNLGNNSLTKKKSTGMDRFTTEFQQNLREELTLMLLKVFHKIEKEETSPSSFYETSVALILKLDKNTITKRKTIDQFPR
jgi:hypothetical protein